MRTSKRKLKVPALAHYRPWIDNLRKEKPYQLDDKIEELFLEKSQTGYSAWNRLFDESLAEMRFTVDGEELSLEPTLTLLTSPEEAKRKAAADALAQTFKKNLQALHPHHQYARQGQGDLRPLARLQGHCRCPPSLQPGRARGGGGPGRSGAPGLSAPVASLLPMKAKWLGKAKLDHWDRNAPLPQEDTRDVPWDDAKATVLDAYRGFAPEMARNRRPVLRQAVDRRAGEARQGTGRLRPSDGAFGPSLRAAQLSWARRAM